MIKPRPQEVCECDYKTYIGETGRAVEYDYRNTGKKFHNAMSKPTQVAPADYWPLNRASQQSQITPSLSTMS